MVQPVSARAPALMSSSVYAPMPRVNSSMSSRARFSLGARRVLRCPSSHRISAGSRSIALVKHPKSPRPAVRKVVSWPCISGADFTFCTLVAQCPCQKKTNFSVSWCSRGHHATQPPTEQRLDLGPGRLLRLLALVSRRVRGQCCVRIGVKPRRRCRRGARICAGRAEQPVHSGVETRPVRPRPLRPRSVRTSHGAAGAPRAGGQPWTGPYRRQVRIG